MSHWHKKEKKITQKDFLYRKRIKEIFDLKKELYRLTVGEKLALLRFCFLHWHTRIFIYFFLYAFSVVIARWTRAARQFTTGVKLTPPVRSYVENQQANRMEAVLMAHRTSSDLNIIKSIKNNALFVKNATLCRFFSKIFYSRHP